MTRFRSSLAKLSGLMQMASSLPMGCIIPPTFWCAPPGLTPASHPDSPSRGVTVCRWRSGGKVPPSPTSPSQSTNFPTTLSVSGPIRRWGRATCYFCWRKWLTISPPVCRRCSGITSDPCQLERMRWNGLRGTAISISLARCTARNAEAGIKGELKMDG